MKQKGNKTFCHYGSSSFSWSWVIFVWCLCGVELAPCSFNSIFRYYYYIHGRRPYCAYTCICVRMILLCNWTPWELRFRSNCVTFNLLSSSSAVMPFLTQDIILITWMYVRTYVRSDRLYIFHSIRHYIQMDSNYIYFFQLFVLLTVPYKRWEWNGIERRKVTKWKQQVMTKNRLVGMEKNINVIFFSYYYTLLFTWSCIGTRIVACHVQKG